jgi:serine/threonine-protein kinase
MLAGEPPFTGRTPQALLAKRVLEPVPRVRTLRDSVSEALDQVVARAMAKAPVDRFATAAELARALDAPTVSQAAAGASTVAPHALRRSRWPWSTRRKFTIGVGALLTLGLGAAALLWRRPVAPIALDADLVAVAPFDVLTPTPGLELWREGLVDVLARGLDGAGPLRTVSPAVVIRRWPGHADRAAAGALAKQLGARLAVYGTLVAEGRDSVRLSANVLDAARDELVAETEARGSAGHIHQLADSLALRLLRQVGRGRSFGPVRWGGLGTRSLPALRAFLRGEQFYRRTEWDSARASYERAVGLDTAFALAYWRLGATWGWHIGARDSVTGAYWLRAFRLAGRDQNLPPRESLLLVFDSLMGSLDESALPDSAVEERVRRLLYTAGEVTRLYPADPEGWAALGEAGVHFGWGRGVNHEATLAAFARAIALDSAYAPAYIHTVELAAALDDRPALRRYAAAFLALRPSQEMAIAARTAVRLVEPTTSRGEVARVLDTLPIRVLPALIYSFRSAPDAEEVGLAVWRRFLAGPLDQDFPGVEESARSGFAASLAFRGHLREASDVLSRRPGLMAWGTFTDLALAGLVPADTAEAVFRRQLREGPTNEDVGMAPRLGFPLPWWEARGDSAAIERYAERLSPRGPPGQTPLRDRYLYAAAGAYLALVRGDTAGAVRRLQALPATAGQVWSERLLLARLLAALRRDREALAVLDREFPWAVPVPSHVWWALERARLAERLREPEKARRWFSYVAKVWRHGDPELQPYVDEAHAALARLSAAPR